METKYVNPEVNQVSFTCPHCKTISHQFWSEVYWYLNGPKQTSKTLTCATGFMISQCYTCNEYSLWHSVSKKDLSLDENEYEMFYPTNLSYFPEPNPDLHDDIRTDYLEAGKILKDSPRGTAALLRLCVQKLVDQLVPGKEDIFPKIAKLVEKGLEPEIQKALDLTRVIGNEAVHPGELDLKDNQVTALLLFDTINLIAEKLISRPKRISDAYQGLPKAKLDAIDKRDKK